MEEDIKIIENIIYNDEGKKMSYVDVNYAEGEEFINAVVNLIARYKEYKKITEAVKLLETEKIPDDTYYVIAKTSFLKGDYENLLDDYIPKSKVKEKIEEYDDILDYAETEEGMAELKDYEYDEAKYGKKVLQELLEES